MDGSIDIDFKIISSLSVYLDKACTNVSNRVHATWSILISTDISVIQDAMVAGFHEEMIMKTFNNAMGKVPPPLMFVTFVLTVFVLTVGSVSAAPNCDHDGDSYFTGKGRCVNEYPPDPDDSDPCIVPEGYTPAPDCSSGGGGSTAPDPYNLARASFATRAELGNPIGGVFADGVDGGACDPYDYWDWQEALLPAGVGLTQCETFLNSSNVSGGGRWFLISGPAGSEEVLDTIERWLVVDFNDYSGPGEPPDCPDLDEKLYLDGQITKENTKCIDNLAIRLSADRILKPKANQQQLDFSIRWRPDPDASIYWPPWGYVSYINPLFLRDPSDDPADPFQGRNCRVMSTRETYAADHTRAEAELLREIGPGQTEVLGTYYLPLEVCVERASN